MIGINNLAINVQKKSCTMSIKDEYCYFYVTGFDIREMLDVLNYQSWVYKAYQRAVQVRYVNIIKNLSNGNVIFRTTIGFGPLLLRYLRTKGYNISGELFRADKIILPNMRYELYDFQKRMKKDWLRAGGVGVVKSPTGSGKTIYACDIISEIQRKTLILVHTSDLLANVWIDSLVKSFGEGITSRIGLVGGGLTNNERIDMRIGTKEGFIKNMDKDIVIATFQTLINNIHKVSNYNFGLVIVDECHHAPAKMFRKVNSVIKSPYKLGLSATINRLDGMEKDIFGQLGNIQSTVSIRELINKSILAEPRFQSPIIVDEKIIDKVEKCGYSGLEYSRFVKKQSASSKKKMDYVVNICRNIAGRDRKFLLFTDYVAAEDVYIRDMYVKELIDSGVPVGYIDQGMAADERASIFNYLETGELLGIVLGKLGSEGVNIPSVNAVVMANGIKSPITFTQRVGRAMRKTPDKDFCDVYEVLLDIPIELKWSDFNFAEYKVEGFQKLVYKVE